jgi:putative ABC transport system permease protein
MTLRLLRKHLTAHAGSLLFVSLVVLALSTLTALMPRATTHVLSDNLRHEIGALTPADRDLSSETGGTPTPASAEDPSGNTLPPASDPVWGGIDDALRRAHADMPPELRAAYGPGAFAMTLPNAPAQPKDPGTRTTANVILSVGFDPRLPSDVTITHGHAPRPVAADQPAKHSPVEIVLSERVAKAMGWPVGQERTSISPNVPPLDVVLSGTYAPTARESPLWTQVSAALTPSIVQPDGAKPIVTGVGWAEPGSYPHLAAVSDGIQVRTWFPLHTVALTSSDADAVATQLRKFTRQGHAVHGDEYVNDFNGQPVLPGLTQLAFTSDTAAAIQDAQVAGAAALAMIALFASGPLGVAAAVLVLAAGLVLRQQSSSLALATARGLSEAQLRALLAIEGLAVGLPSAVAGSLIGAVVLPADASSAAWWWPAVVGLAPAILFAVMQPAARRTERADLTSSDARSWRWTLDLLVLLCAVAAIVALRTRGLDASANGGGVDPLLASTPLVLSLAACLGVIRIYPWVLRQVLARVSRRRGSIALLGTARALRDPAAGLAAVLALVTSVGVAVFSGVAVTTLHDGLTDTAQQTIGADVVIDGSPVPGKLVTELKARDDVRDLVALTELSGVRLLAKGRPLFSTVILVDVNKLRTAQKGIPGALVLPSSLERASGNRVPVLVSKDFDGDSSGLELGDHRVDVVGTAPSQSALTSRTSWILIDRKSAENVVQQGGLSNRLLVNTKGSAVAVRDLARDTNGVLRADTPADAKKVLEASPLIPAVSRAALLALGALAILCASVIALTLVRGEGSRSRQSALLGAMGESRRRTRWLVAWEIGPLAVVSIVSGAVLGLVLPVIVLGGVDLRAFTTGSDQPPISVDPVLTLLITGGVLAVVVIGAALASLASRRLDLSRILRMMED